MDERAVYAGLTQIFRDLFNDDTIVLSAETSAADIEGWDSFNNITLMVAAETEFGVKLRSDEIENLSNIGGLVRAIERQGVKTDSR